VSKDKTDRIFIRVSPKEKKKIEEKAKQVNQTVSGYLLSLSESRRIIDATKMASLIVEIRKIGVNINQIASVANTQKYVNKEMQTKINKHQEKILDLLQKILEEVYDTEEHSFKKMERTLESLEKKIDKQTKKIERLERNSSS
jgi:spore germination protein YaaH